MTTRILLAFLLVFVLPLVTHAAWWTFRDRDGPDWSGADWSSAHLLPAPTADAPALMRIYAARTGRWRGIVAHHSWIVVEAAGALRYTRYDKVGWGSPLRTDGWPADGRWFGHAPEIVAAADGPAAAALIPTIRRAVAEYPHRNGGDYRAWPGPNSNTFVAFVLAHLPGLGAAMPPTALGKDQRPWSDVVGLAPSRTGLRIGVGGLLGMTVGWVEGFEVNVLGLVAGFDVRRPALKLPGWGRIGIDGSA